MGRLRWRARDVSPDAFAVVMATGIVSVAADDHGFRWLAVTLAVVATGAFALLVVAWMGKVIRHGGSVVADFRDPDAALRMFTFVAGSCVLAVVWLTSPLTVWGLGAAALAVWCLLMPLAARDIRSRPRAELRDHARGAWLLASVGTSGLAITAADLAVIVNDGWFVIAGVALWAVAWGCYAVVVALIVWRVAGRWGAADAVEPDVWILMGALAIAALAGAHLTSAAATTGLSPPLVTAVRTATTVIWIVASTWIPALVAIQAWRFFRVPGSLRFAHVWWSAVFPLGMYASATQALANVDRVAALSVVSWIFLWVALAAWAAAAFGLLRAGLRGSAGRVMVQP